jgi:7 transmembrane helices usually fused to an inactive transglutaminase/Transglutaminase-like superfamily
MGVLVMLPLCAISYKVVGLGYRLDDVLPRTQHHIAVQMTLDGDLGRVEARTFLPQSDQHQQISNEDHESDARFRFTTEVDGLNRVATWNGSAVPDQSRLTLSYSAVTQPVVYEVSPDLAVPDSYTQSVAVYLKPTESIQVDSPEVRAVLERSGADTGPLLQRLKKIQEVSSGLRSRAFKGTTDALTALRLGEASCNGKSRLFAALARATGIPTRLVGGLILEDGKKRTSHQWVESYVGGHWVPFDPTNHHFASLPANHLVLYRGDEALFRHTSDVNFDYALVTTSTLVPSPRIKETLSSFNVWSLFERLKLPFSLLRTVLMLPVGALVVVLFRNVVGMPTFGTFLPALIAAAAGETGLFWGIVSIVVVTLMTCAARSAIASLRLLHSPTLAILLAVVVLTMLGTSLVADRLGLDSLARVSYFPIAVLAIASERFYLAMSEQGTRSAVKQLTGTLLVVLGCYVVMNSIVMQALVSSFPELLLLVIAANIYLGKWIGVRLSELWRFRTLIAQRAVA